MREEGRDGADGNEAWQAENKLKDLKEREYCERGTVQPQPKAIASVASGSKASNTSWDLAHSCSLQN